MFSIKDFMLGFLLASVISLSYYVWVGPQIVVLKVPMPVLFNPTSAELPQIMCD